MTIRDRSPQDQAAMHFKAAGLGDRSAREAARLLFETGMTFETAAVLGQVVGESEVPVQKIQEAADRYRRAGKPARTTTAFGRPVVEAQDQASAPAPTRRGQQPRRTAETKSVVDPARTTRINGVEHYVVHAYSPVENPGGGVSEAGPKRSPWGRDRGND